MKRLVKIVCRDCGHQIIIKNMEWSDNSSWTSQCMNCKGYNVKAIKTLELPEIKAEP